MCQQLTVLSQLTPTRYAAVCEHQTLHLYWDFLVILLPAGECDHLVESFQHKLHSLHPAEEKVVWQMNQMTLSLPVGEFILLADMLLFAWQQAQQPALTPAVFTSLPKYVEA